MFDADHPDRVACGVTRTLRWDFGAPGKNARARYWLVWTGSTENTTEEFEVLQFPSAEAT